MTCNYPNFFFEKIMMILRRWYFILLKELTQSKFQIVFLTPYHSTNLINYCWTNFNIADRPISNWINKRNNQYRTGHLGSRYGIFKQSDKGWKLLRKIFKMISCLSLFKIWYHYFTKMIFYSKGYVILFFKK